ncbi:MAG: phosphopantetheine adenylyltransferase [Nitrososphaerales archaeon]
MKRRFRTVALGGTFDYIHKGHKALLSRAFESADNVLIGVTTDGFAARLGKKVDHGSKARVERLRNYLDKSFEERDYQIVPLDDYFGVETYADDVEAVVVSSETASRVVEFNKKRIKMGFKPLQQLVVDTVLADDETRISSSRIRKREIDKEGHLLHNR